MISVKKIVSILILGILISASSCKKYLDDNVSKSSISDVAQWASEGNADIFINGIYGQLSNKGNTPDQLDDFTDDNDGGYYWRSYRWKAGNVGPSVDNGLPMGETNQSVNAGDYADWGATYGKIRRCNLFLQKIDQYKANFSAAWIAKRTDEVKFLRAYFYSELWMHLGGLVIQTTVADNSVQSTDELQKPRSTFEATFNFIDSELDAIVKNGNLAVKYNLSNNDAGRATLGAALCLKGWVELFAASQAFNSGSSPSGADPNNLAHFATADPARWAKAAATNLQFINTYGTTYNLFPNLDQLWYATNEYNSEIIWDKNNVANTPNTINGVNGNTGSNYEQYGGPVYILGNYYTWGNYDPTQELVDAFRMANGKSITDPTSGYDAQRPYVNREQRFYQFIVYDGAPYYQPWMPRTDTIYTRIDKVRPSKNQIDFAQDDVSNTGYYSRKRLNPTATPGNYASAQNYVYYRYAEVLLNYAEAQNEAAGPNAAVYNAINKVRQRSNLPDLTPGLSQVDMRNAIRNERRIELCYENKRFYDIIRWKVAKDLLSVDRHGMQITNSVPANNSGVWNYTPIPLNHPHVFNDNMYLNPIPQNVIDQNPKIVQNPGY
jgi:hypothetical protein